MERRKVQTSIKKKKEAFKNWQREGTDQLKEVYKEKKKEAKRAVAKAKEEGYKEWCENLDTLEAWREDDLQDCKAEGRGKKRHKRDKSDQGPTGRSAD